MKVIHKTFSDETGAYSLLVETPDGNLSLWLDVSESFYDEHDIGSWCEVTVRRGALGYPWEEGYKQSGLTSVGYETV